MISNKGKFIIDQFVLLHFFYLSKKKKKKIVLLHNAVISREGSTVLRCSLYFFIFFSLLLVIHSIKKHRKSGEKISICILNGKLDAIHNVTSVPYVRI